MFVRTEEPGELPSFAKVGFYKQPAIVAYAARSALLTKS
jgi:hypothetical protein